MKSWTRRFALAALAVAFGAPGALAQAQELEGPLTFVVGYAPGKASNRAARLVGEALQAKHGINVIVENKPSAGGRLAAQQLKLAKPTDNVLMLGNPAVMVVAPLVFKDTHYDPNADFRPVSLVTSYEFGVAGGPRCPSRIWQSSPPG